MAPYWGAALPPLGILYLAGYLEKAVPGLQTKATDGLLHGMDHTLAEIREFRPDVLCVSFYTGSALGAYALINRAKEEFPMMEVIAGGPHATAVPEDVLTRSAANVVVRGEGEVVLARILERQLARGTLEPADLAGIAGIVYRGLLGQIHQTSTAPHVIDLDQLPYPAWHLLPLSDYHGYHLCKQSPEYPILFSRGCPFDCVFCPNEHWNLSTPRVRFRSARNIADEMEILHKDYGIREFHNLADELNNHPRLALETCDEIRRRKLGVTWKTLLRPEPVTEELARHMAESGCWLASLGIETGNAETLVGVRKHFTHAQVEETCRLLKQYGIKVQGLFMLFNVWEQDGELRVEDAAMSKKTVEYAARLLDRRLLDHTGWSITAPYPGSELHEIACRHGLIKPELADQWDDWTVRDLFVMQLPGVSQREQIRVYRSSFLLSGKTSIEGRGIRLSDLALSAKTGMAIARYELSTMLGRRQPPTRGRQ